MTTDVRGTGAGAPDVTVVVPVFDALPDLVGCVESLVDQDTGDVTHEVVLVDDGSTDGSGDVLDRAAAGHPHLQVVHQENSGWPGRPRNVGIDNARGRYVFFCDADDRLAPEALRRMVEFADASGSDVVVPKQIGEHGREPSRLLWPRTQVDADPRTLFRTLVPHKLVRRALIEQHGLRFPEGRVPLEDGVFIAQAYCLARRVSVLSDYDYYVIRTRPDGGNLTRQRRDLFDHLGSVRRILTTVRDHVRPEAVRDDVLTDVYRRKALREVHPGRWQRQRGEGRARYVAELAALARDFLPDDAECRVPLRFRDTVRATRSGDATTITAAVDAVARWSEGRSDVSLPAVVHRSPAGRLVAHEQSPPPAGSSLSVRRDVTGVVSMTAPKARLKGGPKAVRLRVRTGLDRYATGDDVTFTVLLRAQGTTALAVPTEPAGTDEPVGRDERTASEEAAALLRAGPVVRRCRIDGSVLAGLGPGGYRLALGLGDDPVNPLRIALLRAWSLADAAPHVMPLGDRHVLFSLGRTDEWTVEVGDAARVRELHDVAVAMHRARSARAELHADDGPPVDGEDEA